MNAAEKKIAFTTRWLVKNKWGDPSAQDDALDALSELLGEGVPGDVPVTEDPVISDVTGIVVLDPGHGGTKKVGGSSANNAISFSGVKEKAMTMDFAKRIRKALKAISDETPGSQIQVHLTRNSDRNLGLADRARFANKKNADVFVSIHFNGFNKKVRGTETIILPSSKGNVNVDEDKELAKRIQSQMLAAVRKHDANAKDRGVKSQPLGVLRDTHLGNRSSRHPTRACLIEIEFIDVKEVDDLLNKGPNASAVRDDIARGIAEGIAQDLEAHI